MEDIWGVLLCCYACGIVGVILLFLFDRGEDPECWKVDYMQTGKRLGERK